MPTTITAFAAPAAAEPLARMSMERRDVGSRDVAIDIEFCGICHSDIHTVRGEWGRRPFPLAPGHEIVGLVTAVGSEVTRHRVGDRVGVGCMVGSCGECPSCQAGLEQFCQSKTIFTYGSTDRDGTITQGGYSTAIVVREDFVLRIPDGLDPAAAAPLLCAGITTYSPLKHWNAGPGKRVAIVGLGGLGHVAVKIAHAMGAEVTVLSQTLNKKEDGLRLGASAYYATSDPQTFKDLRESFDVILNTVSAHIDIDAFLSLLRLDGAMVDVGIPPEPFSVRAGSLTRNRHILTGSSIGGIAETQEMLDFCAEHSVTADIELIGTDDINAAYDRVVASQVRYRFVIDISSLRQ